MSHSKQSPKPRPKSSVEQRRKSDRIDIRYGDGISATIHLGDRDLKVQVYDISLSGLSIQFPNNSKEDLKQFKTYIISIKRSWSKELKGNYTCVWTNENEEGRKFFGLSRVEEAISLLNGFNDEEMIRIPERIPIIAYMYKDIFYNERMAIEFKMLSKQKIVFQLLDTQALLLPGMSVTINLAVLNSIHKSIDGIVKEVYRRQNDRFEVLMEVKNFSKTVEKDLIAHLLYDDEYIPSQMRKAGFKVSTISNNFKFRYIKTEEEYSKVLELRRKAYTSIGKIPENTESKELAAPLDKISRIIAAYHGSKIIATAALSFPHSEYIQLDTERTLPGDYPRDLPPKKSIIEISRLCIDEEYRRSDLLIRMIEHIYKVLLASDRKYFLTSSDKSLWPLYKSLGFKKTLYSYDHPTFKGIIHDIIILDKQVGISSKKLNPIKWSFYYRDITHFMWQRMAIESSLFQRVKFILMLWIGRILKINKRTKY